MAHLVRLRIDWGMTCVSRCTNLVARSALSGCVQPTCQSFPISWLLATTVLTCSRKTKATRGSVSKFNSRLSFFNAQSQEIWSMWSVLVPMSMWTCQKLFCCRQMCDREWWQLNKFDAEKWKDVWTRSLCTAEAAVAAGYCALHSRIISGRFCWNVFQPSDQYIHLLPNWGV